MKWGHLDRKMTLWILWILPFIINFIHLIFNLVTGIFTFDDNNNNLFWGLPHTAWHGHASSSAGLTTALGASLSYWLKRRSPFLKQTWRQLKRKKGDAKGWQIQRRRKGTGPPSSAVRLSASSLKSQMLEMLLLVRCRWMQELLSCLFAWVGHLSTCGKAADPGRRGKGKRGKEISS